MNGLNIDSIFGRAWTLSKKHWPLLLILVIVSSMTGQVVSACLQPSAADQIRMITAMMDNNYDEVTRIASGGSGALLGVKLAVAVVISCLLSWLIQMIMQRVSWQCVTTEEIDLTAQFKNCLKGYLHYLGVCLVYTIVLVLATFCCILPGLYLTIRLMFVPIIAANRPELSLGETFSRSMRLTKGHFWTLVGYGMVSFVIVIVGFLCCCVGVLFSEVILLLFLAETYRVLDADANEEDGFSVQDNASDTAEPETTDMSEESEQAPVDSVSPAPANEQDNVKTEYGSTDHYQK